MSWWCFGLMILADHTGEFISTQAHTGARAGDQMLQMFWISCFWADLAFLFWSRVMDWSDGLIYSFSADTCHVFACVHTYILSCMQQGLVKLRTTLVWQFDNSLTTLEHIGELDIKFIRPKPKLKQAIPVIELSRLGSLASKLNYSFFANKFSE